MKNVVTVSVNFLIPFRDFHLVSQDYKINKVVLENWTLGKLKIPDFANIAEMEDWIIAVDFIVKSQSFFVSGPTNPYYNALGIDFFTKPLSIIDIKGNVYKIPERRYYDKNALPRDLLNTEKLYDYLGESTNVFLDIDAYGQCMPNKKIDGKYFFEEIDMCGLVDFLLNSEQSKYLPPNNQSMFGIKTYDYTNEEDFDERDIYWTFKKIKETKQVFIIEFKYLESKKEDQLDYFNSWRMWHEKFIYNNTMYFVLFQTDEISNENMTDYFRPLQKAISKRYAINCYTLEVKNYLEMKLRLRKTI